MKIEYSYLWYTHLDGLAEENYQGLCDVFDWCDVHRFVERSVGDTFEGEDDAYDACNELLSGPLSELAERLASMFSINLSENLLEKLGLVLRDAEGRKYKVVPEQKSQMFLFPVENPVRRAYL